MKSKCNIPTTENTSTTNTNILNSECTGYDKDIVKVDMYEYVATDYAFASIRVAPNNTIHALVKLVNKTKVYVYSENSYWAYAEYNGVKGYIHSWALQTTSKEDSQDMF